MPESGETNGVVENDEQELAAFIPVRCMHESAECMERSFSLSAWRSSNDAECAQPRSSSKPLGIYAKWGIIHATYSADEFQ